MTFMQCLKSITLGQKSPSNEKTHSNVNKTIRIQMQLCRRDLGQLYSSNFNFRLRTKNYKITKTRFLKTLKQACHWTAIPHIGKLHSNPNSSSAKYTHRALGLCHPLSNFECSTFERTERREICFETGCDISS